MPHVESFPYLTFDTSLVQAEPWQLHEGGSNAVLPPALKDWDPLTDISVSRTVEFDFPQIFARCGLSAGAEIMVAASWHSTGTSLRANATTFIAQHNTGRRGVDLAFNVPGPKVAGKLTLFTRALFQSGGRSDASLAARRAGSILWQDEQSTQLEGFGARFPIQFADFSELGFPAGAGWTLHWTKDFHAQFMGRVSLLINSRHDRLRAIASGAATDPQTFPIFSAIHFDIARELIIGGVTADEFVDNADAFERGSIGEAIRMLIKRMFGDQSPESVRDLLQNERGRFDCTLQDGLRLFQTSTAA